MLDNLSFSHHVHRCGSMSLMTLATLSHFCSDWRIHSSSSLWLEAFCLTDLCLSWVGLQRPWSMWTFRQCFLPICYKRLFSVPGSSDHFSEEKTTTSILVSATALSHTQVDVFSLFRPRPTLHVLVVLNRIDYFLHNHMIGCYRLQSTHIKSMNWRNCSKRDPVTSRWFRGNWRQSRSLRRRKPKWSWSSVVWGPKDGKKGFVQVLFQELLVVITQCCTSSNHPPCVF